MKKILSILPNSIAGTLIIRGFNTGFRANGCYVREIDFRQLKISDLESFKPDMLFGYDYGFLMSEDEELKNYIKSHAKDFKLVHYFADEPNGALAYVKRPELYEEYKNIDTISFIWDKDFLSQISDSIYLPLAVDNKAYRIEPDIKKYKISFVGRPLTEKRQKILAALIKKYGSMLNIFSYERHFLQSLDDMKDKMLLDEKEMEIYKNSYRGFVTTEKELAQVYQSSDINVNITLQGKSSMNYRVFEVPASFGFLLTDYVSDLEENFDISREIETYKDVNDLIDKIDFYLKNPEIAEKIALNGYVKVTKKHSYTARANMLLGAIGFRNLSN